MPAFPGFIGGSNTPQSLIADAERSVNLYVESANAPNAKAPLALYPTPGFKAWSAVGDVGARGAIVADGRLFFVIGGGLYEFTAGGVATKRGTMLQDSNPAQLVYNGKVGGQIGICSGGSIYSFILATNAFAGPHFGGITCTMLNYADGYGVAFDMTTGRSYLSALNDFTTWSLGTFFQRSKFADPPQAQFVDGNALIWTVGPETFEVRYNTGTGTQPWAVLSGLYGREGIAAPFAYAVGTKGIHWLGRSGREGGLRIVTTDGGDPEPISTYAVNTALANYRRASRVDDAEVLLYFDQGHTFANFSFPSANGTWSFDLEGKSWAERGKWNSLRGDYDVWAPRVHADCFGKHLVGIATPGPSGRWTPQLPPM
jgi:hypothetical protein